MKEDPPHILVVDDDARIRQLLERYLARQGWRASGAADAAAARRLIGAILFDLVVLDVMMPGEDGFSLARWLRETGGPPSLLLTARGESADRIKGLEAGADDYLAKPFEPRELALRIEAILRRAFRPPPPAPLTPAPEAPPELRFGALTYDRPRGELRRGEEPVHLTGAEESMLSVLAERPHEPLERGELLGALDAGDERAVDVLVARLRRKLEDDAANPRFLRTVRGVGYRLTPD
ncbi:response regulator [Neomegalonema sp.]|uniref:response regulator n=1 Tax=Neomegalonema sp. TaxID=2039713 RepID=UPI0026367CBB|nr:response regulator [Neomegalonema sp.]MDD2867628.1 response regulator [Neomegalonema sp.]